MTTGYKDEMTEQDGLMRQERQILIAIYQGKIPANIARELGLTPQRVGAVRTTLVRKNWLVRVQAEGKKAAYLVPEGKVESVKAMIPKNPAAESAVRQATTGIPTREDQGYPEDLGEGTPVVEKPQAQQVTIGMIVLPEEPTNSEPDTSRWEFIGRPPTVEEVKALLATLPAVHGVLTSEYFEYVQAIPDFREVSQPDPDRPGSLRVDRVQVWRLYMSVAGRLSMLNAAQALNNWRVDIDPEQASSHNPPGFLSVQPYIVYREHIRIWLLAQTPVSTSPSFELPNGITYIPGAEQLLGTRSGQAGKPFSSSAHPYENVETSARGRALGAWGFGVFPGSGIASLDEMLSLAASKRTEQSTGTERPARGTGAKQSKEELLEDVLLLNEQLRQLMGSDEDTMLQKMGEYLIGLGAKVWDAEKKTIDWDRVKPGQLIMLRGRLDERHKEWASDTAL